MSQHRPRFELARVSDHGVEEVRIVRLAELPFDTRGDRRGFIRTALTASAALGSLLASCRPAQPAVSSEDAGPNRVGFACHALAHDGAVTVLAQSPNGNLLVSGGGDCKVKIWSLPDGAHMATIDEHRVSIGALAISPDGRLLATGADTVRLWSLPSGKPRKRLPASAAPVSALAICGGGKFLAIGDTGGSLRLASLPAGLVQNTVQAHGGRIGSLACDPTGTLLASAGEDNNICLWSLPTLEKLKTLGGRHAPALTISTDGTTLIAGGRDRTLQIWSLPNGNLLNTFEADTGVYSVALAPDGTLLVGTTNGTIERWSITEGVAKDKLQGSQGIVHALALRPDGKQLATSTSHRTIELWTLPEGKAGACLFDVRSSPATVAGVSYEAKNEAGRIVTYTLPCGSPLPSGATCTCNCVPGSAPAWQPEPATPVSSDEYRYSTPIAPGPSPPTYVPHNTSRSYCKCNLVCTCQAVPICQAHRLLDPDTVIRTMAEQMLLFMGNREQDYFTWAAAESPQALRRSIQAIAAEIRAGRTPERERFPAASVCAAYLTHGDPVARILAAQLLRSAHPQWQPASLKASIEEELQASWGKHWLRRRGRA